jgi:hypothetical protein
MANFHYARQLLEDAVLELEAVLLPPNRRNDEGGAWTLRNLGLNLPDVEAGLYGSRDDTTQAKYRERLGEPVFLGKVNSALRKAVQDLDRFLAHFPIYEAPAGSPLEQLPRLSGHSGLEPPRPTALEEPLSFLGRRLVHHRSLSTRTFSRDPRRTPTFFIPPSSSSSRSSSPSSQPIPLPQHLHLPRALLTTFHPFLLEAHSTRLVALFLLGDFTSAAQAHTTFVRIAEQIEGYPLFSPPRVGTQAEYAELVERVWETWGKEKEPAVSTALVASRSSVPSPNSDSDDSDDDEEGDGWSGPSSVPENESHLSAVGPAHGSLLSLSALTSLFSTSFRTAYVAKAEAWWSSAGKAEEERREAAAERARSAAGGKNGGAPTGANGKLTVDHLEQLVEEAERKADEKAGRAPKSNKSQKERDEEEKGRKKGTWLQEREKAEAKMRKIDPSCAFFSSLCPLFLLLLTVFTFIQSSQTPLLLPHTPNSPSASSTPPSSPLSKRKRRRSLKRRSSPARERVGLGRVRGRAEEGSGKGKGKGRAVEEDEGGHSRTTSNGWGGGGGSSSSAPFNPFGTGPSPTSSFSNGGGGENGPSGSSSSSSAAKGKGNGKGKSRAF